MAEMKWQPIETAPSMKSVLVSIINPKGNRVTVKAMFAPKHTWESDNEFSEYDEDADKFFAPEGWYEDVWSDFGEDYSYIYMSERPTDWMPLPDHPSHPTQGDE